MDGEIAKITDFFEQQVVKSPNGLAVMGDNIRLTYQELNERANKLARVLREKGVGSDQSVAIMAERSAEMIVGILAILKAGGAYLPVDPTYPQARMEYLLRACCKRISLTCESFSWAED